MWPPIAREGIEENLLLKRRAEEAFYESSGETTPFLRNELIDKYYFLNLQSTFSLGKSIIALRESAIDLSLSETYRDGLRKDIKWLEEIYSTNSESLKQLFEGMKKQNLTNTPPG
jgi:hypothetical protein